MRLPVLPTPSPDEVASLVAKVRDADAERSEWLTTQQKLTRQRFGHQRRVGMPWDNASDVHFPTQDKAIRRWKSRILALVYDVSPVAYFRAVEPGDVDSARLVEQFYDWLFRVHMSESAEELSYLADLIAHRGFALLHLFWDYRTEQERRLLRVSDLWPDGVEDVSDEEIVQRLSYEYDAPPPPPSLLADIRAGRPEVVLEFETVVADRPRIAARDPIHVLVPGSATSVADAEWICVRHYLSTAEIRARFGVEVEETAGGDKSPERLEHDSLEGVRAQDERHEVYELYCWRNGADGRERHRAIYWIHADSEQVLAAFDYVYPFHTWPFVKFDLEKTVRRWYAPRGISRMLSPFATLIDQLHNARMDAIQLQLTPTYKVRGIGLPEPISIGPGRLLPVGELTDVEPLLHDLRNLSEYLREEFHIRQAAEEYAGTYDSTLMSVMAPTERRTAAEVAAVTDQLQTSFALDAKVFQAAMAEAHRMIWQLWYEFGPDEVFFRTMGEEIPRPLRRSEVVRNYDIVPAGTIANTSKALELARAREALQFLLNDQSGVIDRAELVRWYLGLLDWALSKRIVRSPEQLEAYKQLMTAANEVASGSLRTILEQAQVAQALQAQGTPLPGGVS